MNKVTATATCVALGPIYNPGSVALSVTLAGIKPIEGRRCDVSLSFDDVKAIVVKACGHKDRAAQIIAMLSERHYL